MESSEPERVVVALCDVRGGGCRLVWVAHPPQSPWAGAMGLPATTVEELDAADASADGATPPARAALRALFTATGVLWADGAERLDDARRAQLRRELVEDPRQGARALRAAGLRWRTAELEDWGWRRMPGDLPGPSAVRLLAVVVDDTSAAPPELPVQAGAERVELAEVEQRRREGRVLVAPPLDAVLAVLRHGGRPQARRLPPEACYEPVPGVRVIPLRTPTLPPATHTNAYLVGDHRPVWIEPASPYADEIERVVALAARLTEQTGALQALVATHHHGDHVGGAAALQARLGLPLWAHRETVNRLDPSVRCERWLEHGDRIEVSEDPHAALEVVHTPGHAPGHVCLMQRRSRAVVAGDMVAGVGTILVDPHDGDMGRYLDSLRALRALQPSVLFPAHGGPILDPDAHLAHYVAHRLEREDKVRDALRRHGGAAEPSELVPDAYADAPRAVWPLAARSVEAHLRKLQSDGEVERRADRWALRAGR